MRRAELEPLPKAPAAGLVIAEVDRAARAGARLAVDHAADEIRGRAPRRTGAAAAAIGGSVRRDPTGYRLTVQPNTRPHPSSGRGRSRNLTNRVVWRWIERGIGLLGDRGRLIPERRRGLAPTPRGPRAPSGRGYRARRVFSAARPVLDRQVPEMLDRAARDATRRAGR